MHEGYTKTRNGPDQHTNLRTGQIEAWLWVCFKAGAKSVRGELGSGYYTTYYIHNTRIYIRGEIDLSRPSNNSSNVPSMLSDFDLYINPGISKYVACIRILSLHL